MSRLETVSADDGVFFDAIEEQSGAATFAPVLRRGFSNTIATTGLLTTVVGTAAVGARRNGVLGREWTSVLNTLGTLASPNSPWPVGQDWTTHPATERYPTRWYWEGIMQRIGATLAVPFAFGMEIAGATIFNPFTTAGAAPLGMLAVGSVTPLNAGRWTVAISPRTGTAATTFDTGIAAATPIAVRCVYEDAAVPRAWVEVNGVQYGLVTGFANVPACADASPAVERPMLVAAIGAAAASPAGQVDRLSQVRVWAQSLGSWQ